MGIQGEFTIYSLLVLCPENLMGPRTTVGEMLTTVLFPDGDVTEYRAVFS